MLRKYFICCDRKNARMPTKCSSNKGFGGKSSVLPRSNFRVGGQKTVPQSLTAATLERWLQGLMKEEKITTDRIFNNGGTIKREIKTGFHSI